MDRTAKAPLPRSVHKDEAQSRSSGFQLLFGLPRRLSSGARGKEEYIWFTAAGTTPELHGIPYEVLTRGHAARPLTLCNSQLQ